MNEKTSHLLLGVFVLSALAIAVASFLFMAGQDYNSGNAHKVVMVFDGSVTGLNTGAPVAIRGANIGQVTDIQVRFVEDETGLNLLMQVEAVINESSVTRVGQTDHIIGRDLIASGLRAQLNTLSMVTGLLYVQLDFVPDSEPRFLAEDSEYLEIPTIPSPLQQLVSNLDRLNLPNLAADIQAVAQSLRDFTSSEAFLAMPENANRVFTSTARISEDMEGLLARLEPKIEQTLASTTSAAITAEQQLPLIASEINASLTTLDTTLKTFNSVGENLELISQPDSPLLENLNTTLAELARASRSINTLARSLEERPQSLILGRPEEEE